MKLKINKSILLDIFVILVLSLTPLLWFRPGEIMVGHDNVFPLDPKAFLSGRLYTWNQNQGFGQNQSLIMGTIPIHLIDALPFLLGFSLQTTQKLVYVFWFFLIGLSVYVLASLINPKSRFFKLFATLFYQFNFFILQGWWIGERTKFSAYIALPLVLSVFLLVYQRKISILKATILNSLILFAFNAGGLFGIPLYGGFFVSVGLFIVFFSLMSFFQKEYSLVKNLILVAVLTVIGFLLVNSYYLLPAFSQLLSQYGPRLGGIGGVSGVLAWVQEISAGASFTNLFRLQGIAEWYDNPQHPYAKYFLTNPILISISFIWPLLIFASLILVRKKREAKYILYFFLVYLVGIFFTAGTHSPLGFIYQFFVQTIPGFAIFRTPYYKFAPALFLPSAFLCAYTLDFLKEKTKRLAPLFCLFWFALILGYHFPYFTGNFFNWREDFSTRLKVPQYVFDFGRWLKNEKRDNYRILLLPPLNSNWQYDVYRWGHLSLEPLVWLFNAQPIVVNGEKANEIEKIFLEATYKSLSDGNKELFEKLANLLQIKYLLVRKDFFYDVEWGKTTSPFFYQRALNSFSYPQEKEFGEWELYSLDLAEPDKIFTFSGADILTSSFKNIKDYLEVNPLEKTHFFATDGTESLPLFLKEGYSSYIIPECLNCRHEKKPVIDLPERKILPGSPLYPLLLLKEKRQLGGRGTLKAMVYDDIGLSLKRASEIRELILQRKSVKEEDLDRYIAILERIGKRYDQIQEFEEKFELAEDLNYFLEGQKKYLQTLLGTRIFYEKEVGEIRKIFSVIYSLQEKIDPFVFKKEQSNNRLYSFFVQNPGVFELLVKKESIQGVIGERLGIEIRLDDYLEEKIEFGPEELENEYLSLGRVKMAEGKHRFLLSLPLLPNLTDGFIFGEGDFWRRETKCFTSKIRGFDNRKVYKIDLVYKNDFSDNFLMIIQKKKKNGEKLENIFEFPSSHEESEFEELIYTLEDIEEASMRFCAPELTSEILAEKVHLRVTEVIHPLIILVPPIIQKTEITPISFEKINPTKYRIRIRDIQSPFMLAFLERYDDSWKLSGFEKNHFELNGYANGWWIDKEGDYDLVLEYTPQRLFYWGSLISGLAVILSLLYIFR